MRGEGRGEVGQQLKKMRTGSYAKITIAQVFSSRAISFLFQLRKKIANALRIKRERQKGKQLFSSLEGKKIFCRETKAKPLSEMQSSPMMLVHILQLWVQVQY